jgi:hypothetical protein
MSSYVSADLRRLVASRARGLCEYCLIHEDDTYLGCQVDHVISEKHGGESVPENLAYACAPCNRAKGSNIASVAASTAELTRLFNPRTDRWADHFTLEAAMIQPQSPIGEATIRTLAMNHVDRVMERRTLHQAGRYPSPAALKHVGGTSDS